MNLDLKNEFSQINNAKVASYIDSPGVYLVQVEKVEVSEEKKDYKKTPFFSFYVKEVNGQKTNIITLYRATNNDTPDAREVKLKRLKEFFLSLGVDLTKDSTDILKDCVGKQLKALYKQVEKIKYDKNANQMPYIFRSVEYSFSKPANEDLVGNHSYFYNNLNHKEQARFEDEYARWEKENPSTGNNSTTANTVSNEEKFNQSLEDLGKKEEEKKPENNTNANNGGGGLGAAFGK